MDNNEKMIYELLNELNIEYEKLEHIAITSVKKGAGELAVGNVVGADILNVLFVLGLSAAVTPKGIGVPTYFYYLQIPSMLFILIVFRFCSTRKSGVIGKKGGAILFSFYMIYLFLNFLMKGMH